MPVKKIGESLDWSEDWAVWLAGDLISTSTWIAPDGLPKGPDGFDNTTTTIWLAPGGTPGKYTVHNEITTLAGRIGVLTRKFRIRDI